MFPTLTRFVHSRTRTVTTHATTVTLYARLESKRLRLEIPRSERAVACGVLCPPNRPRGHGQDGLLPHDRCVRTTPQLVWDQSRRICLQQEMSPLDRSQNTEQISHRLDDMGISNAYRTGPVLLVFRKRYHDYRCCFARYGHSFTLSWCAGTVKTLIGLDKGSL